MRRVAALARFVVDVTFDTSIWKIAVGCCVSDALTFFTLDGIFTYNFIPPNELVVKVFDFLKII